MLPLPSTAALLVIDVQKAIDHPNGGNRNNPDAEARMSALLTAWRERNKPVFHIRHDATAPASPYRPGQPLHAFKEACAPRPGEAVVPKRTTSAFVGTDLEMWLRRGGHTTLVVCGGVTNNAVESTVRMAGNLGFDTYLAEDATFTFDRVDWHGRHRSAEEVHALSLANLHGEYCTVVTTAQVLASVDGTS